MQYLIVIIIEHLTEVNSDKTRLQVVVNDCFLAILPLTK